MNAPVILDRRHVLKGGGALIISFSLTRAFAQDPTVPAAAPPSPPGSLKNSPYLDSWIRIDADGVITVFTGKAELGQGFKTAFQQIAAEELNVPFASLKVVTADTKLTANEGYTSGSHSMQDSGTAIQNAAAQARELLLAEAAKRLDVSIDTLQSEDGVVIAPDGRRLSYGELVSGDMLHVQAQPSSKLKDPSTLKVMGQSIPRGHSRESDGRGRLCTGLAALRHGACTRGAPAKLWSTTRRLRRCRDRKNAGRRESGS